MRFVFLLPLLMLGCRQTPTPKLSSPALLSPSSLPVPNPNRIPDIEHWTILGPVRPSFAGPHRGSYQRLYINAIARQALDENRFRPWPEGSQLIKEALNAKGRRTAWFWMSKERDQWIWATANPPGKVLSRDSGAASGACAACHMHHAAKFDGSFAPAFAGKGPLNIPLGAQ